MCVCTPHVFSVHSEALGLNLQTVGSMWVLRIEPGSSASVLAESSLQLQLSSFSKQREIKRTDFEVRTTGGW